MLRGLIERFAGLALAMVVVGIPALLLLGRFSPGWLFFLSLLGLWGGRLVRRLLVGAATGALARGDVSRARLRYRLVAWTAVSSVVRLSCRLSLAACSAAEEKFARCLGRLEGLEVPEEEKALAAVAENLRAYCFAREGVKLEEALGLASHCVAQLPQVQGFRHTRGLVLLELGRYDEAIRDFESSWQSKGGAALFESERCFDLGRLWTLRGQADYAKDYFARALQAYPEGRWADKARERVGPPSRATTAALETLI